jgi:nucleotide-binding universal stress UspA family protein
MRTLVGIDGGTHREDALALATQLAAIGPVHDLTVVHVYPWSPWSENLGNAYELTIREDAERLLEEARASLGDRACRTLAVADVKPARALHRLAVELDAQVIVAGSCHRGRVGRTVLGGIGDRIVHGAPRPVAIAPRGYAGHAGSLRHIGVAFDGSPEAQAAAGWGREAALNVGGDLLLMGVLEAAPYGGTYAGAVGYGNMEVVRSMRVAQARVLEGLAADMPEVGARCRLLEGPVATALADAAHDLDLLVAGSRGYGPVGALLLGAVSRVLAHEAPCPLVLLPRTAVGEDAPAAPPLETATTS